MVRVELTKKYITRKFIITGIKKYKGEIICMVHIRRVHRSIEEVFFNDGILFWKQSKNQ